MKKIKTFLPVFVLLYFICITTQAQGQESRVKIFGEVEKPFSVNLSEVERMTRVEVVRKDRDNKDHHYSGVPLSSLLAQAGVTLVKELRGENLTKYVLMEASDGYQFIFSLAELDAEFSE